MGLNNTYSDIKSSILMMDPLPSVGHAYSLLIQDEKQRLHMESHPSHGAFMISNKKFNNNQRFNSDQKFLRNEGIFKSQYDKPLFAKPKTGLFCTQCNKINHEVSKC